MPIEQCEILARFFNQSLLGIAMRLLAVISHYFKNVENAEFASGMDPFPKIAALNEEIVALYRNFGSTRHGAKPAGAPLSDDAIGDDRVDIVVLTVGDQHLLDWTGLDQGSYEVVKCDCPPMFLGFEAQRIFRERLGQYDFYAFLEDDLTIHDPAFFDKLAWFQQEFGSKALLQPLRYEMTHSGTPAKVAIDFDKEGRVQKAFRRQGQSNVLSAKWKGREQSFTLPLNPHSGCYFLTEAQLRHWITQPSFDDRDSSWTGPLESAATLSVGKVFDIYKPSSPNPWFLEIQHFGARYANLFAPDGVVYGEPPLLSLAREACRTMHDKGSPTGKMASDIPSLMNAASDKNLYRDAASRAELELKFLRSSPRRLFLAMMTAVWNRATRSIRRVLASRSSDKIH